jgi:TRAP transporter TAXI family solute receptor
VRVRITGALALAVLLTVSLVGCGGNRSNDSAKGKPAASAGACSVGSDVRISIATGNATGVYYAIGNAFAVQLSDASGGKVKATAAETGASVQNIQQLVKGDYQVAFSLFDTATDAVAGKGAFKDQPQNVVALARIYDNYTHVVVRNDSGINSVADMKGKRISTGSPKSGTEVIANRLLTAAGLNPETDIKPQRLDLTKTTDGMKDGSIDGFFWSGGLPTPGVTDLFTTAGDKVKFIDVTPLLPKLAEINAAYQASTIPASSYPGTSAEVPTIVVPNVLLARPDLDAAVACTLTKALFDKKDELVKANKAATGINLDTARKTDPVQLHPGAKQALDSLGAK